jgi:DNA-directed RNA polymerase subunit RPC12/RpoP
MYLRKLLAIGLILLATGLAIAKDRTWTSSDGRTMQGEFVRELDGEVTFLVKGKLVTIPIERLSERDQQIVRDLAAGKPVPDDVPPQAAATNSAATDSTPATKPAAADPFAPVPDRPAESADPAPLPTKKKSKGPETRVWTDIFGRKATGKFIRIFGSNVVVSRAGGPLTIDYFQLSEADQAYVRELLTSRGEEDLIPVKPPPRRDDGARETGDIGPPGGDDGSGAETAVGPGDPGIGPGIGGPAIGGPGVGPRIGGPGIGAPGGSGPGFGGPGGFGPRGPSGPSGMGSGMPGPRLGPAGSGFGPGSSFGPDSSFGPGSGLGGTGPRGPGFPPGIGPPGNSAGGTAATSPPYSPPQTSNPPTSDFGNSASTLADQQAERIRRETEAMHTRLDEAARSSAGMFQRVPVCSNCRKQVTEEESKRSTCPHCGARWVFNTYNPSAASTSAGGRPSSSPLSSLSASAGDRAVRTTLIVVGAIVVVVVLCGGAIAVALALASASRPAQRYRI